MLILLTNIFLQTTRGQNAASALTHSKVRNRPRLWILASMNFTKIVLTVGSKRNETVLCVENTKLIKKTIRLSGERGAELDLKMAVILNLH